MTKRPDSFAGPAVIAPQSGLEHVLAALFARVIVRTTAAFGSDLFPALNVPEGYFPHEWSPNAQPIFRDLVDFISANHDIKGLDLANMLAVAVGTMIEMAEDIEGDCNDKDILAQLALEIMYGWRGVFE